MITQKQIKELIHYDKDSGVFTWKVDRQNIAKKGMVAGSSASDNYLVLTLFNKQYKAHRIAWMYEYGHFPKDNIDHINGNKKDNRIINLRDVTSLINHKNMSIDKRNKSGKTGVTWHKLSKKWITNISVDKRLVHLGYFENIEDAIKVRQEAENKYSFHMNHGRDKITY